MVPPEIALRIIKTVILVTNTDFMFYLKFYL